MKTVKISFAAMIGLLILSCSQVKRGQKAPNTEITSNVQPPEAAVLTKDAAMRETITGIIKAYQTRDEKTLNSYVYKNYGIIFLFRRGAFDNITKMAKISFQEPMPEYFPYETDLVTDYKISDTELPEFSCATERWNKPPGIYVDSKTTGANFSTIAKNENELIQENSWPEEDLRFFREVESKSHEVIVLDKNYVTFVFYIAYIDGRWYLTAIDRYEVCSA